MAPTLTAATAAPAPSPMSLPDLFVNQSWRDLAACRGLDVNLFHAPLGRGLGQPEYTDARKVCGRCPVRAACLDYALENREEFGMWGGTTPQERQKIGYGPPFIH